MKELVTAIEEYVDHHNTNPKPFIWTKSARDILQKIIRDSLSVRYTVPLLVAVVLVRSMWWVEGDMMRRGLRFHRRGRCGLPSDLRRNVP